MPIPQNHPLRVALNDEVHARPPEALQAPLRVSYLALYANRPPQETDLEPIRALAKRYGAPSPAAGATHYSADLGPFRVKWERHTEFMRYKIIARGLGAGGDPFTEPAINVAPADWISSLKGEVVVAAHAAFAPADGPLDHEKIGAAYFKGNALAGSRIAGGAGAAFTDFRIHADGFNRWMVYDFNLTPRQAGRLVQRLFEVDTYRILALLAFPVARSLIPFLTESERELAEITSELSTAVDPDEQGLLKRLMRLEAAIESRHAENVYRFSAAAAYDELVQRRIAELREQRIEGLQTFQEFTERRLAPAMNTCRAAAERQHALSERVARATQLLSTRVALSSERQRQAVLNSMDRRAQMQLRLQQTVEGLSVAAITYYIVGLVGYAAKGLIAAGAAIDAEIAMAVSIPIVALAVAFGVRSIRKTVLRSPDGAADEAL